MKNKPNIDDKIDSLIKERISSELKYYDQITNKMVWNIPKVKLLII
jgi:hypothetical protein